MIFVSVGSSEIPFRRLVEAVDKIADIIGEKILAQIGCSPYIPKKCEYFRFCERDEILSHIRASSMVISHAGFGTIGNNIKLMKPMILVPREFKYGEALHEQYELAEYLASENESIICLRDLACLEGAIDKLRNVKVNYTYKTIIPNLIDSFITLKFNEKT